jgi:hypothetical protein
MAIEQIEPIQGEELIGTKNTRTRTLIDRKINRLETSRAQSALQAAAYSTIEPARLRNA